MARPLSFLKYYQRNRRKVNVVFAITFCSVFLQFALSIYATFMLDLSYGTRLTVFKSFTFFNILSPTPQSRNKIINLLNRHPSVAKILPCETKPLCFSFSVGACTVFFVEQPGIHPLMQNLKLKLIQGRLPTSNSREAALHWRIAANKGLKIGDRFDKRVFPNDYLAGEYRLTGIIDGKSIIGFADLNTYCRDYHTPKANLTSLIVPQPGQLSPLKEYLRYMARQNRELRLQTASENAMISYQNQIFMIVNVIHMIITGILVICTGFLFYLYFYQRRAEFGLLEALGHNRQMIISRSFGEILTINLLGFGSAFGLCLLGGWILNHFVLMKQGLPLALWDPGYFYQLFSTPLFVTFCALVPVWRMLKRVDPIAIIEGQPVSRHRS